MWAEQETPDRETWQGPSPALPPTLCQTGPLTSLDRSLHLQNQVSFPDLTRSQSHPLLPGLPSHIAQVFA